MVGEKLPELAPFEKFWGRLSNRDRLRLIVACEALLIAQGKLTTHQFEANEAADRDNLELVNVGVAQKLAQLHKENYENGHEDTPLRGITRMIILELAALKH